jgi:predicted dehydrogenase
MREEILSGRWGRVKTIVAYNAEDWITPNRGTWRHDPALCPGGFFYDASGHQLDTLMWVTGLTGEAVRAEMENRDTPIPITIWGTARLTDNVPLAFSFIGDAHRWRELINIHCEGMDFVIQNADAFWLSDGQLTPLAPNEPRETGDAAFIRLIRGEGPNWAPLEEIGPVLRFTRAALLSAETGAEVQIDGESSSHPPTLPIP